MIRYPINGFISIQDIAEEFCLQKNEIVSQFMKRHLKIDVRVIGKFNYIALSDWEKVRQITKSYIEKNYKEKKKIIIGLALTGDFEKFQKAKNDKSLMEAGAERISVLENTIKVCNKKIIEKDCDILELKANYQVLAKETNNVFGEEMIIYKQIKEVFPRFEVSISDCLMLLKKHKKNQDTKYLQRKPVLSFTKLGLEFIVSHFKEINDEL
jgi:flagellar motility protein MotE (MotC chaperone)